MSAPMPYSLRCTLRGRMLAYELVSRQKAAVGNAYDRLSLATSPDHLRRTRRRLASDSFGYGFPVGAVRPLAMHQPGLHVSHLVQQRVEQNRLVAGQHQVDVERQLEYDPLVTAGRMIPDVTEAR